MLSTSVLNNTEQRYPSIFINQLKKIINNSMLTIKMNHDNDTITGVLAMTKEETLKVKAAMIFSILSPKVLSDSLFDDESEVPANMKTKSGSIEAMLSLCDNDAMVAFGLLNFINLEESLSEGYYLVKNSKKIDELVNDEKDGFKKALKMMAIQVKLKPISLLIDDIKNSNGNFIEFYNKIKPHLESAESMFSSLANDDDDSE